SRRLSRVPRPSWASILANRCTRLAPMHHPSLVFHVLAGSLVLAGCGAGADGDAGPLFMEGPASDSAGMDMNAPGASSPSAAGGENPSPDIGLDPSAALDPALPAEPMAPEVPLDNGRIVDGTCTLVCADASTDPDD